VPSLDSYLSSRRPGVFFRVGVRTIDIMGTFFAMLQFLGDVVIATSKLLIGKAAFSWSEYLLYAYRFGPRILPMVILIAFLFGIVITTVSGNELKQFNALPYLANIISLSMVRIIGPILTAFLMLIYCGAVMTNELGLLRERGVMDQLKQQNISPMERMVLPRILVLMVNLPLMYVIVAFTGTVAGLFVARYNFDLPMVLVINKIHSSIELHDIVAGFIESISFGLIIAIVGCFYGVSERVAHMKLGRVVLRTIMVSLAYIIIFDTLLEGILSVFGI